MCVIIHVPANLVPDEALLKKCFDANPHGWGIMFAFQNELVSFKDKSKFEDFLEYWRTTPQSVDRFVHFRIKTHGEMNADNCHPFSVNTGEQEFLMMHNGIVDVSEIDPNKSDTWHFSKLLSGMYHGVQDFLDDKDTQKQIANATSGSRMVFLRQDGMWYKFGTWSEKYGMSFSNLVFDYKSTAITGTASCSSSTRYHSTGYYPASDRAPYYGASGAWYDEYDEWGDMTGLDAVEVTRSDDPPASSYIKLNSGGTPEDYTLDTFEESISRIDEYLEDCEFDDAVAVVQHQNLAAADVRGWFGQAVLDQLFNHILDTYHFSHSSSKGDKS